MCVGFFGADTRSGRVVRVAAVLNGRAGLDSTAAIYFKTFCISVPEIVASGINFLICIMNISKKLDTPKRCINYGGCHHGLHFCDSCHEPCIRHYDLGRKLGHTKASPNEIR